MAEKVLGAIAPELVGETTTSRRARAKRDAESELRQEVEAEMLKRCGIAMYGDRTREEQETRQRIWEHVCRLFQGPQDQKDRRAANPGNVVAFAFGSARPDDGSHPSPGAA
jgi:hypothetical protein